MTSSQILDLAWLFFVPLIIALVPLYIGERIGNTQAKHHKEMDQIPMETVVTASFGLLAFMLAFTFQIAVNRWEARKLLLYTEVQEIRTTYLRAGLIPEPYNSNTKKNLAEYVNIRVGLANDLSKLDSAIVQSKIILDTLWNYTEALARQDRSSEVYSLYTTSVNQIVDAFYQRLTISLVYRIPTTIINVLTIVVFLSMLLLGYHFGVAGKGHNGIKIILAVLFSVVMFLILALDRPETGILKLDQTPLLTLQKQLNEKMKILAVAVAN
jgi:hypothetical protein